MSGLPAGLLDTSVFIARESGRPLGILPEQVTVSVITIGELELGVAAATDAAKRARRADTLAVARGFDPLPVSEAVMVAWAQLVADCRRAGARRFVKLLDSLIAATAVNHGIPVVTQDADYDAMAEAHDPLKVERV